MLYAGGYSLWLWEAVGYWRGGDEILVRVSLAVLGRDYEEAEARGLKLAQNYYPGWELYLSKPRVMPAPTDLSMGAHKAVVLRGKPAPTGTTVKTHYGEGEAGGQCPCNCKFPGCPGQATIVRYPGGTYPVCNRRLVQTARGYTDVGDTNQIVFD